MSCSVASQGVKATGFQQRAGSQRKRAAKNQHFFLLLPILPQPYLKPQPQHPSPWVTHQLYPILNFRWIRLRRSYRSGSALSLSTHFYPGLFSSLKPHIAYMTLRTHFITKHAFYYMQSWKREILEHINCQNKLTTCYIKHWTFKVLLGLHTTDFHQSISTWRKAWLFMSAWYEIFQTNAHKRTTLWSPGIGQDCLTWRLVGAAGQLTIYGFTICPLDCRNTRLTGTKIPGFVHWVDR